MNLNWLELLRRRTKFEIQDNQYTVFAESFLYTVRTRKISYSTHQYSTSNPYPYFADLIDCPLPSQRQPQISVSRLPLCQTPLSDFSNGIFHFRGSDAFNLTKGKKKMATTHPPPPPTDADKPSIKL